MRGYKRGSDLRSAIRFLIVLCAFPVTSGAFPIVLSDTGQASIVLMEFHPSCTSLQSCGSPGVHPIRTLVDTSQTLSYEIGMTVESDTGAVSDGTITILSSNTIELKNLSVTNNDGLVPVDFSGGVSFSFSGDSSGALVGSLDDGTVTTRNGSVMTIFDIGNYTIAPGPAIVPFTGAISPTAGTLTIDPITFRFDGNGSSAFIDLQLGEFAFAPIPEPSTGLLIGLGLGGLALRRKRGGEPFPAYKSRLPGGRPRKT